MDDKECGKRIQQLRQERNEDFRLFFTIVSPIVCSKIVENAMEIKAILVDFQEKRKRKEQMPMHLLLSLWRQKKVSVSRKQPKNAVFQPCFRIT